MRTARWLVVGMGFLGAIACGPRGPSYRALPRNVRESVHRDFPHCRGRDIRGMEIGPGARYQVLACGMELVYVCPSGPHSRWRACVPEQTAGGMAPAAPMAAPPSSGVTIVVAGGSEAGTYVVTPGPAPQPAQAAQPAQPAAAPAPAPAPAAAAPTMEQIEAGLRVWIDGHRAEILSCTGTPAALVEVSWDATGTPTVALGGEMHGSAGEPCVARVLSGVQLNVGGQAGAIRHVVQ